MKTITKDPVCGMEVEASTRWRTEHGGAAILFCSESCLHRFEAEPVKYSLEKHEPPEKKRGAKISDYVPLLVIVGLALLAACAKQIAYAPQSTGWNGMTWMHDFMGFFLVMFSMFKFFNLAGFADGFQMYDLLAKPFRPYAYIYPFIELGLGLGYLAHWWPMVVYGTTVVVMFFGSLGVLNALRKGLDLNCACMGTVLKVPLSTVALVEDVGMAAMAAAMMFAIS